MCLPWRSMANSIMPILPRRRSLRIVWLNCDWKIDEREKRRNDVGETEMKELRTRLRETAKKDQLAVSFHTNMVDM